MHGIWCCHLKGMWCELKNFDKKFCNAVWVSASQIVSLRKLTSSSRGLFSQIIRVMYWLSCVSKTLIKIAVLQKWLSFPKKSSASQIVKRFLLWFQQLAAGQQDITRAACGRYSKPKIVTKNEVSLQSPGYPENYGNSVSCEWRMKAPRQPSVNSFSIKI